MALYFYPLSAKDKIGFTTILQTTSNFCMSEEGREYFLNLKPSTDPQYIEIELKRTAEFKDILQFDDELPLYAIPPLRHIFAKAAIEGNYCTTEEFFVVLNWLKTIRRVTNYLKQRQEKYPELSKLLDISEFDTQFIKEIELIVSEDGKLRSNASPELMRIRKAINDTTTLLRNMLQRILREARQNGWADDKEPTLRNERYVIPIKSDFKGRMKGLVQDLSSTGQTMYLEPLEALPLNNEVRELYIKEKNEIIKILTQLTDKFRPLLKELNICSDFLITIDIIRARASLALKLRAVVPKFATDNNVLDVKDARHPLLILQKNWEDVVPMSFKLDDEKRIMVISGPNAGGKSVSLKCAGLLTMMLQSGMMIPVKETSVMRIFTSVFVDIGDDQSIQNDLSTYTSHLTIMVKMLKGLSKKSLFLVDEFGTGTDPKMGGAIAESLLQEFVKARSYGIITTHYSNIKEYANKHLNIVNAAMRFDLKTITPTYQLEQGLPGSSYAFDIASRVGIPPKVIAYAKSRVGDNRIEIESLLATLKEESDKLEAEKKEIKAEKEVVEKLVKQNEFQEKEIKIRKNKIIAETRQAAAQMLSVASIKIDEIIEELKKSQIDKNTSLQIRKKLNNILSSSANEAGEALNLESGVDAEIFGYKILKDESISVGDFVKFDNSHAVGKVLEIIGKKCVLEIGELRTQAKIADLVKVLPKTETKPIERTSAKYVTIQKVTTTPRHMDIRGMRVEEALETINKFMDDVVVADVEHATILHGKGTGALRNALREHLKRYYPQIKKMEDAPIEQGGSGITIIRLKR